MPGFFIEFYAKPNLLPHFVVVGRDDPGAVQGDVPELTWFWISQVFVVQMIELRRADDVLTDAVPALVVLFHFHVGHFQHDPGGFLDLRFQRDLCETLVHPLDTKRFPRLQHRQARCPNYAGEQQFVRRVAGKNGFCQTGRLVTHKCQG